MASQLLTLALSLLIAAQQPNVPESLKIQAVSVAQYSISVAIQDMGPIAGIPTIPLTTLPTKSDNEVVISEPTTTPQVVGDYFGNPIYKYRWYYYIITKDGCKQPVTKFRDTWVDGSAIATCGTN